MAREKREMSYDDAMEEVIADACEMMLTDPSALNELASDHSSLAKKIRTWLNDFIAKLKKAFTGLEAAHDEAKAMAGYMDELRTMWGSALSDAARGMANKNAAETGGGKMSVREIERDGVKYGIGVYLDSTLLENLTDDERVQMVKERVRELGGQSFTAYDDSGNAVSIKIAEARERFKNKNGKKVSVTEDLATKYSGNKIKQESVVLADELITTAKSPKESTARYPHGWLDNYGKNKWEQWTSYIQDKSGNVWAATLHVANARDGLKYLYDINPIKAVNPAEDTKKVERRGKSRTPLLAHSITDSAGKVNTEPGKSSARDNEYLDAVKSGDIDTAKEMVDEAAEEAGYDIEAYHVSMNGAFNVFDKSRLGENTAPYASDAAMAATAYLGFWFSDHDVSKPQRGYGFIPGEARQFRLSADSLYSIELQDLADELLNNISEEAIEQFSDGDYSAIREAAEGYVQDMQQMGYSGLIVQDFELGGDSYVMFDPEQIKSADAVVYDDNGKVIPLSERFNAKKNDIRYSARDLTDKYPYLNLNQDISELDGVPAIELADGSILPITERYGRYPTHVSFIEGNRIELDDLKSGGWIGSGVYDPSFTSDTQRYIERQQAKRRVAELTGKEYKQFGDVKYSLREYSDEQIEDWKDSKRIVIYDNDMQLLDFIRDAKAGKNGNKKMYFGMVPQNLADRIYSATGLQVENYNCSISAYEIQKIFKSHGNEKTEAPRGQRAITEADIVDIPDILQNADSIVLSNEKYEGKPVIVFTRNGNGRISLVGVVSDKHLDLFVQTMYANKKGNLATPMDEQSPIFTPKAARGTVSDNSIRDTAGKVNTEGKYSMRDVTEGDTKQELEERKKAYAQLRRENAALKKRVEYLKGQTKMTKEATVREADTAALANAVIFQATA